MDFPNGIIWIRVFPILQVDWWTFYLDASEKLCKQIMKVLIGRHVCQLNEITIKPTYI